MPRRLPFCPSGYGAMLQRRPSARSTTVMTRGAAGPGRAAAQATKVPSMMSSLAPPLSPKEKRRPVTRSTPRICDVPVPPPSVSQTAVVPETAGDCEIPWTFSRRARRPREMSKTQTTASWEPDAGASSHTTKRSDMDGADALPAVAAAPSSLLLPEPRSVSSVNGPASQARWSAPSAEPPSCSPCDVEMRHPALVAATCGRQVARDCSKTKPAAPRTAPASKMSAEMRSARTQEWGLSGAAPRVSGAAPESPHSWVRALLISALILLAGAVLGAAGFVFEQSRATWRPQVAATSAGWRISTSHGLQLGGSALGADHLAWEAGPFTLLTDLGSGMSRLLGAAATAGSASAPAISGRFVVG